ncbi:unnamed protein product [Microthlaspi erraticum]|uniref:Uncharacterized protein n=1 Tax=Microthlaspi erraticum TaxID=1685480 RepID=A0A6D2KCS5_9BRAS|nr:unnamed protein product [Microthlaspi erraticum]
MFIRENQIHRFAGHAAVLPPGVNHLNADLPSCLERSRTSESLAKAHPIVILRGGGLRRFQNCCPRHILLDYKSVEVGKIP